MVGGVRGHLGNGGLGEGVRDVVRASRRQALRLAARGLGGSFPELAGPLAVIAPHSDDEVLGCGGLLAQAAARGAEAHVLTLSDGGGSHRGCGCGVAEEAVGAARRGLCRSALQVLGLPPDAVEFLGQTDGALPRRGEPGFDALADAVAERLRAWRPAAVFAPHPLEGWSDHAAGEELARAALSRLERPPVLYHYCVWFWFSMPLRRAWRCDWRGARLLDIADVQEKKREALAVYLDALAPCGTPWVGRLPGQFLRAFEWSRELFFEARGKIRSGETDS